MVTPTENEIVQVVRHVRLLRRKPVLHTKQYYADSRPYKNKRQTSAQSDGKSTEKHPRHMRVFDRNSERVQWLAQNDSVSEKVTSGATIRLGD